MIESRPNPTSILAQVRLRAVQLANEAWPELGVMVDAELPDPMDPVALLPVATGLACGGALEPLIPTAAATVLASCALRIVDDCADQDDSSALYLRLGVGRAMNTALALVGVATRTLARMERTGRSPGLLDNYIGALLSVCFGQDQDIQRQAHTLAEYEEVVRGKTVGPYEFAALAGAWASTQDPTALSRIGECGRCLGWMIQILDDIEAFWFPEGEQKPNSREMMTFPVLYALSLDVPGVSELSAICGAGGEDLDKVRAKLDEMDVRPALMTRALDYRDMALEALGPPLNSSGRELVEMWLDWLFRDGDRLIGSEARPYSRMSSV